MTPADPYRIHYSGHIQNRVRGLLVRAVAAGIGPRVATAFRHIEDCLLTNPAGWGEYIFRLKVFGLDVYHRIHDGMYVVYSVHAGERRVWLTRVYPIIGHPLHDPTEPGGLATG